jgi:hypothetical protein
MSLAELETFCSRPIAPTRRVALGSCVLPVDPGPGFGGILLGGIVARFGRDLDEETIDEVDMLINQLEAGRRIPQPRLRHRLQTDRVGLTRCRHRLVGVGERIEFRFDEVHGTSTQHVLCAVYAAERIPMQFRPIVLETVRAGLGWALECDQRLIAHLTGDHRVNVGVVGDPILWAMTILDLTDCAVAAATLGRPERGAGAPDGTEAPERGEVQRAYRDQLYAAHPDHGGDVACAADRIAELGQARRILLDR